MKKIKRKIVKFLLWTQKWTKTDMLYLAKGSFWLNAGKTINAISALGLTVAFANLLSSETYGSFKFTMALLPLLSIPTLNGLNTALLRSISQGNEGNFYLTLKTKIKWGIWGTLGAIGISGYYLYNGNHTLFLAFLIASLFIPFLSSLNIWIQYLNGKKDFKHSAQYETSVQILHILAVIITIFFTKNLFTLLFVHFASHVILRLIFLLITLKKYPPNSKKDSSSINFGKHLSLMSMLGPISNQIDKILLFHFLGPIQLIIYTLALKPVQEFKKPLKSLGQLAIPRLSQRNFNELKKTIPIKIFKFTIILLPIILIYILLAPILFNFLFSKYTEAILYSQIYSLTFLLFPASLISQTFVAHAQKKQLYIFNVIIPCFKILSFAILLPLYGIWGAIFTLIFAQLFTFLILFILFKQATN